MLCAESVHNISFIFTKSKIINWSYELGRQFSILWASSLSWFCVMWIFRGRRHFNEARSPDFQTDYSSRHIQFLNVLKNLKDLIYNVTVISYVYREKLKCPEHKICSWTSWKQFYLINFWDRPCKILVI